MKCVIKAAMERRQQEGIRLSTPYAKHSIMGVVRKGGGERGHSGDMKGEKSSGHDGKRKGSGTKLNRKKNCTSKTRRGSLMYALGRSGIVADVVRKEGEERSNDLSVEAQAGEGCGDDRPSSKKLGCISQRNSRGILYVPVLSCRTQRNYVTLCH